MIQVRGLCKEFIGRDDNDSGVLAIDNLNLEVRER